MEGVKLRGRVGFFLVLLPLLAQAGDWHTYTNTNYLNDLKIVGNRVWWGTTGGVVRYDNADSSYAIYRNTEGLGGIDVRAVEVDDEGNLWFGLANGTLNRLKPNGEWKKASLGFGINYLRYHQGYIWAATEQALIKFDPQAWLSLEICEQPGIGLQRDKSIRCLFFQGDTLWAGTEQGISYIDISQTENLRDPAQWTFFTSSNSSLGNNVINAIISSRDTIYAGTAHGIYRFAHGSWSVIGGDWQNGVVYDQMVSADTLLAVTAKGVWRWENGSLDSLKCPSSVPRRLSIGPQGELWVGTWGEGILRYGNGRWQYPFKTEGPIGNKIADMVLDDEGNLWLASPGYGMSGFDGKKWENFTPIPDPTPLDSGSCPESPIHWGVCAVAADRLGNKWFGFWSGGVIKLDSEGNQTVYDEDNSDGTLLLSDPRPEYRECTWLVVVNKIMVDSVNNKYFANLDQGLIVLDSSETQWLKHPEDKENGLLEDYIGAAAIDNRGRKWFGHLVGAGSSGGISLLDDKGTPLNQDDDEWEHFLGESDGLSNNTVNCFAIDLDGSIWIGTDEGVSKYDFWGQTPKPGYMFLPDYYEEIGRREVTALEVDLKGDKWFGTSNGLLRYDEVNFLWQEFTPQNSDLLDEKINCLLLDRAKGHLWIGTDKGLSMYELGIVKPKPKLSTVSVYPNPFLLSRNEAEVIFDSLTATSTVSIFTVNGELVREISSEGSGRKEWNGRNQGGNLVASGVYIWVVRDKNGNSRRGKIAVIR